MESDKDLAVTDSASAALSCLEGENGLEEISQEDFIVPVCYIVQDKSKVQDREPQSDELGLIYNPVTECLAKSLTVIPLVFTKTRILMPETYDEDNTPLCGSLDFVNPSNVFGNQKDGTSTMQSGPCEDCHFSKWNLKRDGSPAPYGKKIAPACNEVWNFLFIGDDLMPFWMRFKSTSLPGVKKYASSLLISMKVQKGRMWHFESLMQTTEIRTTKGKVYAPLFRETKPVSDERKQALDEIRASLSDLRPPHGRTQEKEEKFDF